MTRLHLPTVVTIAFVSIAGIWIGGCVPSYDGPLATIAPDSTPQVPDIVDGLDGDPELEVLSSAPDRLAQYVQPDSLGLASDSLHDYAGELDDRCITIVDEETGDNIESCLDDLNLCQEILLAPYREALLEDLGDELGYWNFLGETDESYTQVFDLMCDGDCDPATITFEPDASEDATARVVMRHAHVSDLHGSTLFHPVSGTAMEGPNAKTWASPLSVSPNAMAHLMAQFHHDVELLKVSWISVTGDMADGLGRDELEYMAKLVYGGKDIDPKALVVADPVYGQYGMVSVLDAGNGHYDYFPATLPRSSAVKAPVPGNQMNPFGNLGIMDPSKTGEFEETVTALNGFLNYIYSMDRFFFGSGIQYSWSDEEGFQERYVVMRSSYLPPSPGSAPLTIKDWIDVYTSAMDGSTSSIVASLDDTSVRDQRGNWALDFSIHNGDLPRAPFHFININTVFPLLAKGVLTKGTRDFVRRECQYARDNGLIAIIASHHGADDIYVDADGSGTISTDYIDFTALFGIEDIMYQSLGDELAQYAELLIAEYGINTDETIADIVAQTRVVAVQVVGDDQMNDLKVRYGRAVEPTGLPAPGGERQPPDWQPPDDWEPPDWESPLETLPVLPMLESHAPAVGVNGSYVLSEFRLVPETEQHDAYLFIDRTMMDIQRLPDWDFAQRLDLDAITGCGPDAEARKGSTVDRRARIYLRIPNETDEDVLYYQSLVQQLATAADHTPQQ